MIDKTLIEKFLRGECRQNEAVYVSTYLRQHPDILEEFLPEEEWNKYLSTAGAALQSDEEIYGNIQESIQRERKMKRIVFSVAGVAAVLLLFFGIRILHPGRTHEQLQLSKAETIQKNETSTDQSLLLPDHSVVILAPGSEIRYDSNFNVSGRRIILTGKAEFSVAKDKQKPFTVYSGKISTTALGTRFSVDGNTENISVVLYEGKVVVQKVQDETVANFLAPGDKLNFNINKEIFEIYRNGILASNPDIHPPSSKIKPAKSVELPVTQPAKPDSESGNKDNDGHINFQNQNLKSILSALAERYGVEINYPTEISTSINVFISVDTTQSIDKILQNIAILNNLEVKKERNQLAGPGIQHR